MTAGSCARPSPHQPHFLPIATSPIPLPRGFRPPPAPAENALTAAKVELGRLLFYDVRLSQNGTQSCASCHQQRLAFTDGLRHAIGSTGEEHYRNTMTLANAGYRKPLTWADPSVDSLEVQMLVPLTNHDPVELRMGGRFDELVQRLRADSEYQRLFAEAFPEEPEPIDIKHVAKAVASFERALISGDSPWDRLVRGGDEAALTTEAWQGMRLFFSERIGCSSCHGGRDFDTPHDGNAFQNNGIIDVATAQRDRGLASKSGRRADFGRFRVPTLRNIEVTGPYMHDGSAHSLDEVLEDYAAGGHAARRDASRPARGVGIHPFRLSPAEKAELLAFLDALTDREFLTNPRFADPRERRK
jgi:cytochrome c peroxidase